MNNVNSENCRMFPIYRRLRIARTRVGVKHPDVRPEWVGAAQVKEIKLEYTHVSSNITRVANWLGYGLEIHLTITEGTTGI